MTPCSGSCKPASCESRRRPPARSRAQTGEHSWGRCGGSGPSRAGGKRLVSERGTHDLGKCQPQRSICQRLITRSCGMAASAVQKIMRFRNQKARADAQHLAPAVVVGGSLNALGVVRSLSVGSMPIYLLDTTRACAAGWSRYCRFVPIPALDGKALIDALIGLAAQLP